MKKILLLAIGLFTFIFSPSLFAFDYEFQFDYTEYDDYLELEIYNHHYDNLSEIRLYRSGMFVQELDPNFSYWNLQLTGFTHNTIYEFFLRYKINGDDTWYNSVYYTYESTIDIEDTKYVISHEIDFENETKPNYESSSILINGKQWILSNTMIGSDEVDQKNGLKSARIQSVGSIQNVTSMRNIAKFSFLYGNYGTNTNGIIKVYMSYNGTEWLLIESLSSSNIFRIYEHELDVSLYYYDLFFKIELSEGGRVNIDDIFFYSLNSPPDEPEPEDPVDPDPEKLTDIDGEMIADGIYDYQIYQANLFWLRNDTYEHLVHVSELPDEFNDSRIKRIKQLHVENNNIVFHFLEVNFEIFNHEMENVDGIYILGFELALFDNDIRIQNFKVNVTSYSEQEWNLAEVIWNTKQVIPQYDQKYLLELNAEYIRAFELLTVQVEYYGIEYEVILEDTAFIDSPPPIEEKTGFFAKVGKFLSAVVIGPFYTLMSLISGETTLETIINNPITDKILFVVFFIIIGIVLIKLLTFLNRFAKR